MSEWGLPTSAEINGHRHPIRSDYRAALDVLGVLSDPEMDDQERGACALTVFYPDLDDMPREDYEGAVEYMRWFLAGGDAGHRPPSAKLADWEQDFPIIVGAVNRVIGYEVRAVDNLHWWTFLAAYAEVGDCLFAQVVAIRKKLAEGRKLEKHERRFYREHRDLVDLKVKETPAESELLDEWIGGSHG